MLRLLQRRWLNLLTTPAPPAREGCGRNMTRDMIYDLVIIGGASAGLTAGIYAARKKLNAIILTKQVGGQSLLTNTIENFPGFEMISGRELIEKMRLQVENYGVPIKEGIEVKFVKKEKELFLIESIKAKSVIIATGRKVQCLNIPGEKEFKNKGVSSCSTCDAPLFAGKKVAVIGGGNSGLETAADISKYASKIYVLGSNSKIIGDELLREKLKQTEKVEFITSAAVQEIKGKKFVEKIIYKNLESNQIKEIAVDGVFINIGWIPASDFLSEDFVETNERGEIIINPATNETSTPGVFAAGDVTNNKYKQCIIAAADGAKAALSAYNYLLAFRSSN
jgi:thioredoxin-disulfide reductase